MYTSHVPPGGYRIEGTSEDAPPLQEPDRQTRHPVSRSTGAIVRELGAREFSLAEALWADYHNTKGGRKNRPDICCIR